MFKENELKTTQPKRGGSDRDSFKDKKCWIGNL